MKQSDLEALLGRSLTELEVTNLKTYLKIANEQLNTLLCYSGSDEDKTYIARHGYRSIFTEPFTEIDEITVDGDVKTDYTVKQNNSLNGDWFNVVVFDEALDGEEIVIKADWGFGNCMPKTVELLLAKLFETVATAGSFDGRVKQKTIQGSFSVTYADTTAYEQILKDYAQTISKYSVCNVGEIQHGHVSVIL